MTGKATRLRRTFIFIDNGKPVLKKLGKNGSLCISQQILELQDFVTSSNIANLLASLKLRIRIKQH